MWAALTKDFAEIANNIKNDSMNFVNMISDLASDVIGDSSTIYAGDEALWANNSQEENTTNEVQATSEKANNTSISSNADNNIIAKSSTPMGYNKAQYKSRPMPVVDNTSLIDLQGSDSTYLLPITNHTATDNNNNNENDDNNVKEIEKQFALWKATSPLSSYNLKRSMQHRQKYKQQKEKQQTKEEQVEQTTTTTTTEEKDKKETDLRTEQGVNDFITPTRSATEGSEYSPSPTSPMLPLFATHHEPTYAIRQRLLNNNELVLDKYVNLVCQDDSIASSHHSPRSATHSVTREADNVKADNTLSSKIDSNDKQESHDTKDATNVNNLPSHSPSSPLRGHADKRLTQDEFFDRYFFRLSQLREKAAAATAALKQDDTQATQNDKNKKDNNIENDKNYTNDKEMHIDHMAENTNDLAKKEKESKENDVYVPATCTNTEDDNSEDDATDVKWATKELSSFATCVLQAANKFAANLDDVINLGMNAQEEGTDDDNVTPPSSLSTSPLKTEKQKQNTQLSENRSTQEIRKSEKMRRNEPREHAYEDSDEVMNAYKMQIVELENVIQQLQERVRVTDRRVNVLTKLLHEHNIAIPQEELLLTHSHSSVPLTNISTINTNNANVQNATQISSSKIAKDPAIAVHHENNVSTKEEKGEEKEKVEIAFAADHEPIMVDSNASSSIEEWEQINAADCELEHTTNTDTNTDNNNNKDKTIDNNTNDKKKQ